MKCPKCNKENSSDTYCVYCGFRFNSSIPNTTTETKDVETQIQKKINISVKEIIISFIGAIALVNFFFIFPAVLYMGGVFAIGAALRDGNWLTNEAIFYVLYIILTFVMLIVRIVLRTKSR